MGVFVDIRWPRTATLVRRGPWLALALTLVAIASGSESHLEFDRLAIIDGQWWRIFTGHFVHYNSAHSIGDIAAFTLWAALIEAISRRTLAVAVSLSVLFVGIGILLCCPSVMRYRGLSGIDIAFAIVLLGLLACSPRIRNLRHARAMLGVVSVALLGKTIYEFGAGAAILAPDLGNGVALLPAAHAFGALAGVATWFFRAAIDRIFVPIADSPQ
jgi:rhomboid family GlyGly-CTERM serine protease